jgi:transposase InsO family protein
MVLPYLYGKSSKDKVIAKSTIYRWISQYKRAEELFNCGYIGLLPEKKKRGNRIRKLHQEVLSLMDESINKDYENVNQKSKYAAWVSLVSKCEEKQFKVPSYKTYCQEINNRPKYQSYLKRKGYKVAYEVEPFYWELEQTTIRHGDRPFEVVHIDHTELDVELICPTSDRNLGRPWLSLMMDAYSRRILAFFLGFDPPSYRSCMMVLRDCVRRYQRLPQNIIVDGGREFESVYFETLLARYECTKKTRPIGKPRFGSVIERLFGTTNTQFIHNLTGNTQIRRNVRQITAQVDPNKLAKWTLASLYELLHKWAYEIYETIEHPALGQSPRDAFTKGLAHSGSRQHRLIVYDEEFFILTLPTTKTGKAKVIAGKGVVINHIYYWSETFRHGGVENTKVAVRYDPFDAGIAYAYVRNRWVRCISELYTRFQGRSQKELMLATTELRKRIQGHSKQFQVTANKLANFLAAVETQEILLSQRLQDNEAKKVIALMEGKTDKKDKEQNPKVESKSSEPRKKSKLSSPNINTEEVNINELEVYEDY